MKHPQLVTELSNEVLSLIYSNSYLRHRFKFFMVEGDVPNRSAGMYSRVLLKEGRDLNKKNVTGIIASVRNKVDYVSVLGSSPSVISAVISSRLVDAVRVTPDSRVQNFNHKSFQRCYHEEKFVEVDLSSFLRDPSPKKLRPLLRLITHLRTSRASVVLVNSPRTLEELRSYRDLRAVAEYLGIPREQTDPTPLMERLEENRRKLEGGQLADGLEVVE